MSTSAATSADAESAEVVADKKYYDVLVVGGGVAGSLVAALAGSQTSLRVGIVDPKPLPDLNAVREMEYPDIRVFAITPTSAGIIDKAGAWETVQGVRAPRFTEMQVWESTGGGHVRWQQDDSPEGYLGYIAENRLLHAAISDRLQELQTEGRVDVLPPASLSSLRLPGAEGDGSTAAPFAEVELDSGDQIQAALVVGCDGGNSQVRRLAEVGTWGFDYEQRGVVATVKTLRPHSTAWQRFLPSGPLALLPLWDEYSSIVWSCPPEQAKELSSLEGPELADRINAAFATPPASQRQLEEEAEKQRRELAQLQQMLQMAGRFMGQADNKLQQMASMLGGTAVPAFQQPPTVDEVVGKAASFPLRMQGSVEYARPRLALVGDAAHTVHPLAGQGLNLGIADADSLVRALAQAQTEGADVGTMGVLGGYDKERRAQVQTIQFLLDTIKRMFAAGGGDAGPASLVRSMGMLMLNSTKPIKTEMARLAMGGGDPRMVGKLQDAMEKAQQGMGKLGGLASMLGGGPGSNQQGGAGGLGGLLGKMGDMLGKRK